MESRSSMRHLLLLVLALAALGHTSAEQPASPQLSEVQIEALATEILRHTPEHVHFEKGTTFSWVLFVEPTSDESPELTKAVLRHLKARYTVYRTRDEIPPDKITVDRSGDLIGYRDGFKFGFSVSVRGAAEVEIRYSDWVGNLAASSQSVAYRWSGSQWEVVWRGPLIVA